MPSPLEPSFTLRGLPPTSATIFAWAARSTSWNCAHTSAISLRRSRFSSIRSPSSRHFSSLSVFVRNASASRFRLSSFLMTGSASREYVPSAPAIVHMSELSFRPRSETGFVVANSWSASGAW